MSVKNSSNVQKDRRTASVKVVPFPARARGFWVLSSPSNNALRVKSLTFHAPLVGKLSQPAGVWRLRSAGEANADAARRTGARTVNIVKVKVVEKGESRSVREGSVGDGCSDRKQSESIIYPR